MALYPNKYFGGKNSKIVNIRSNRVIKWSNRKIKQCEQKTKTMTTEIDTLKAKLKENTKETLLTVRRQLEVETIKITKVENQKSRNTITNQRY